MEKFSVNKAGKFHIKTQTVAEKTAKNSGVYFFLPHPVVCSKDIKD